MTGENEEKTVPWIEEHGAEYAYGYLSAEDQTAFMAAAGMRGYPSAILVDPKGEIVWAGHPASLTGSTIEKHLRGADRTPVETRALARKWPESAKDVIRAVVKGDLADALKEARELPENDRPQVVQDVERVIDQRTKKLEALLQAEDYLGFAEAMDGIGATLEGLPPGDELAAQLKAVEKDREKKAVMNAQKKLHVFEQKALEEDDAKKLGRWIETIQEFAQDHPGTIVARQGDELVKKLVDRRERLR